MSAIPEHDPAVQVLHMEGTSLSNGPAVQKLVTPPNLLDSSRLAEVRSGTLRVAAKMGLRFSGCAQLMKGAAHMVVPVHMAAT